MGFLIAGGTTEPTDVKHHSHVPCPLARASKGDRFCIGLECPVFEPIMPGADENNPKHGLGRCGLGSK